MPIDFKIDPAAKISDKQFHLIRTLAGERVWTTAPTEISLVIKRVTRHEVTDTKPLPDVRRLAASKAISFMLSPQAPKVAATVTTTTSVHQTTTKNTTAKSHAITQYKNEELYAVNNAVWGTLYNKWEELQTLLLTLPVSKYAVWCDSSADACWMFIEVREQKSTKKRYLNKLLGSPGNWAWAIKGVTVEWQIAMAKIIAQDPAKFATNYCNEFTRCSACDSPLSDKISIAEAMGPVCRKKFKW